MLFVAGQSSLFFLHVVSKKFPHKLLSSKRLPNAARIQPKCVSEVMEQDR